MPPPPPTHTPLLWSAPSFYIAYDKASNFTVKSMLTSAFCFPHFLLDSSFKADSHYKRSSLGVLAFHTHYVNVCVSPSVRP